MKEIIQMYFKYFIVFILVLFTSALLEAQIDVENVFNNKDTTTIGEETNPAPKRNTFLSIFEGRPGKAALFSLVIPGGGQAYNKKWWKIPLAWGIDGAAGYWVYHTAKGYKYYDTIYRDLLAGKGNEFFRNARDVEAVRSSWRQRKEYAWVYMGIAHLVTVFDAYVDRHLIEFDINEDLTSHNYSEIGAFPLVGVSIPLDRKYNK